MPKSINQEKCLCRNELGICQNSSPLNVVCNCPCHSKEKGVDIIVCPVHGNKEYKVDPPHFCKFKINKGCNCVCTCPTPKNESWEERFDEYFDEPMAQWTKEAIKSFISQEIAKAKEEGMELRKEYTEFNKDREQEIRQQTLLECREKIMSRLANNSVGGAYMLPENTELQGYNRACKDILKILEE